MRRMMDDEAEYEGIVSPPKLERERARTASAELSVTRHHYLRNILHLLRIWKAS